MAKINVVMFSLLVFLFQSSFVNATMRSLTPAEQAATCYSSSPMLYSDACFGQTYSQQYPPVFPTLGSGGVGQMPYDGQMETLMATLNSLQGVGGIGMDPMAGMGAWSPQYSSGPNLMEPTGYGQDQMMIQMLMSGAVK